MLLKIMLVFSFGLSLHLGAAECNVFRPVPIRLLNEAAAHQDVVVTAQREATYILKSLCVDMEWVAAPSIEAFEMRITLAPLGREITNRSLGVTFLEANRNNRGTIFLSRVRALQAPYASLISLGKLLGCVLAHEIGHLVLNSKGHSSGGIMTAHFGKAEICRATQRRLLFTPSDREILFGR